MSDSRFADLLQAGADALAPRSTPPGGWQPPTVEQLQQALPQYEISSFIARGGMGAVYKGTQKTLKRSVAIKVLPPEIDDGDMQFAERFKREAQSMAQLTHPNIVAVFDAGETAQGLLYFVMEFIEGTDVAQLIQSEKRLDPQRAMSITTAVCEALAFAHEEGIIHRDIKPSNIMLDRRGRVKVADFGLAKTVNMESTMLTGSNVAMGTPDFIAPEALIAGIAVDGRADVYAVGVMLYQMLTGSIPRGRFALPSGVIPQIDPRLDAIVDKAMQTDRERRYSTATEMKVDVERISRVVPDEASAQSTNQEIRPTVKSRRPLLIGLGATAALAIPLVFHFGKGPPPNPSATKVAARAHPEWQSIPLPAYEVLKTSGGAKVSPSGELIIPKGGLTLPGIQARNIAVRGEMKPHPEGKLLGLNLRSGHGGAPPEPGSGSRQFALYPTYATTQIVKDANYLTLSRSDYPATVNPAEWMPFEFAVIEDTSLAMLGGVPLLPTGHSSEARRAGGLLLLSGQFRNLEYINLDGLPEADAMKVAGLASVSSGLISASSSPEPAAIKLWDSAEKLPANTPTTTARWENGAVRLSGQIRDMDAVFRDGIVRASVRMIPGAQPQLLMRHSVRSGSGTDKEKTSSYSLYVSIPSRNFQLGRHDNGQITTLKEWPFLKTYATNDWARLEVKLENDEITFSADGQELGKVRDTSPLKAGNVAIHAKGEGYFRDIEYVPLEAATAQQTAKANPSVFPPGKWIKWPAGFIESPDATHAIESVSSKEEEWLLPRAKVMVPFRHNRFSNVGLRAKFRQMDGNQGAALVLRSNADSNLQCLTDRARPGVISVFDQKSNRHKILTSSSAKIPAAGTEFTMEFYAVGPRLISRINGSLETTQQDANPRDGTAFLQSWLPFTDLEIINLDGLSEAEALKLIGVTASVQPGQGDAVSTPAGSRDARKGMKGSGGDS